MGSTSPSLGAPAWTLEHDLRDATGLAQHSNINTRGHFVLECTAPVTVNTIVGLSGVHAVCTDGADGAVLQFACPRLRAKRECLEAGAPAVHSCRNVMPCTVSEKPFNMRSRLHYDAMLPGFWSCELPQIPLCCSTYLGSSFKRAAGCNVTRFGLAFGLANSYKYRYAVNV